MALWAIHRKVTEMNPTHTHTPESLYERLDCTFHLLYEGINQNDPEKVDTALTALPQVMHDAIDSRCYQVLGRVERGMMLVFGEHKLLNKTIAGSVSEDILEQVLGHATPHMTDLAGMGREKMTVRVGKTIAASLIKRYTKGVKDYQSLLFPFEKTKHLDTYKMIYTHLLKSTLLLSEAEYRKNHMSSNGNLFHVTLMNGDEIFSAKHEAIAQVLFENQDLVLKHLDIQRRGTYIQSSPINIRMICKLHEMGFERLAEAWGPNIFYDLIDPRQLILAEQAGIAIDKDLVTRQLLFKESRTKIINTFEADTRIPEDALIYALESDRFTLGDLEELRSTVAGKRDKTNLNLNLRMPSSLAKALQAVYRNKMAGPSELLVQKTEMLVSWAMNNKPSPYQQELTKVLLQLPRLPKHIILTHHTLRDAAFGADLGL